MSTLPSAMDVLGADGRPLVMGVLNVTPDSFSDGGRFLDVDAAISRGLELAAQGADIVDVGGESTKPGADPVSPDEERRRVLPVIEALVAEGLTVSIDTLNAGTAIAAVGAGAAIVNDVSGGEHDPEMRRTVAETAAAFVVMHWRGVPDPHHRRSSYGDVVTEVREELARLADAAIAAGVAPERLVLDPGLGFDKTARQGWELLAGLPRLTGLGHPVLVGVSRKRMIAETLAAARDLPTAEISMEDRDLATAVVSALAAGAGAWGVRVHEVAPTVNALAVAEAWDAARQSSCDRDVHREGGSVPLGSPQRAGTALSAGEGAPDRIALTGLEVFAHHGVFGFERERGQRFLIDVELSLDLRAASAEDELGRTVHYGELAESVVAAVERDPVDLIETVAERVARVALGFSGVAEARVTVHKPDAPIEAEFADVSVTVVRSASSPGASPKASPSRESRETREEAP
ncbi:MAG: dihydropteroate synthase [Leucobacter sp.]